MLLADCVAYVAPAKITSFQRTGTSPTKPFRRPFLTRLCQDPLRCPPFKPRRPAAFEKHSPHAYNARSSLQLSILQVPLFHLVIVVVRRSSCRPPVCQAEFLRVKHQLYHSSTSPCRLPLFASTGHQQNVFIDSCFLRLQQQSSSRPSRSNSGTHRDLVTSIKRQRHTSHSQITGSSSSGSALLKR